MCANNSTVFVHILAPCKCLPTPSLHRQTGSVSALSLPLSLKLGYSTFHSILLTSRIASILNQSFLLNSECSTFIYLLKACLDRSAAYPRSDNHFQFSKRAIRASHFKATICLTTNRLRLCHTKLTHIYTSHTIPNPC